MGKIKNFNFLFNLTFTIDHQSTRGQYQVLAHSRLKLCQIRKDIKIRYVARTSAQHQLKFSLSCNDNDGFLCIKNDILKQTKKQVCLGQKGSRASPDNSVSVQYTLSKYFQKKKKSHYIIPTIQRLETKDVLKNKWLLSSQCDGGNFNYLHHNVMMVTIFLNGYLHHNVIVTIFSKWSPSSHCDEGNYSSTSYTVL